MFRLSLILLAVITMDSAIFQPAAAQEIVAHRGASDQAPENTLAAFRLAWKLGADAIEGDFRLTSDGHVVCIHDDSTGKVSNADLVVADCTLAELRRLDVGSWKSPDYSGELIPTLAEVLAIVPEKKKILIEVKCGPEIVPALQTAIKESRLDDSQITVISFNAQVVSAVGESLPDTKTLWLTSYERDDETGKITPDLDRILHTLADCGADGLDTKCDFDVLQEPFMRALRQESYEVHAWTVNNARDARRLKSLGIDSITTDVPDRIRAALADDGGGNEFSAGLGIPLTIAGTALVCTGGYFAVRFWLLATH